MTDISEMIDKFTNGTTSTLSIIVYVLLVIAWWKIFDKANEPGWASIIPIYNLYVLFKITWGKGIAFLLLLIPIVNIIVYIATSVKLCKVFGKSTLFGILSIFFLNITTMIIGFGSASYQG